MCTVVKNFTLISVALDEGSNAVDSGHHLFVTPNVQDLFVFKEQFPSGTLFPRYYM